MKIDSSTIGMESARSYKVTSTTIRRFAITEYQAGLTQSDNTLNAAVSDGENETEEQNPSVKESQTNIWDEWQNRYGMSSSRISLRESVDNTLSNIKQTTIRYIFDLLFASRRDKLYHWLDESGVRNDGTGADNLSEGINTEAEPSELNFMTSFKVLNYTQETIHMETENTYFSTVGTVRTSDGREIQFNVEVGMSREFSEYYREDLELASFQMCDPLVINLDTDIAKLSDQKFFFDIDADGEQDEISQLDVGSGYLALDHNGDGKINDGSELFGTSSGDGFADLAKYDEDSNGWIDENDSVWSKLQIWCMNANGENQLYRLSEKGVGAICLQRASTDFTLQGSEGMTNGAIRSTGVFLYENGNVGTVQHLDVAKYEKKA